MLALLNQMRRLGPAPFGHHGGADGFTSMGTLTPAKAVLKRQMRISGFFRLTLFPECS